MALLWWSASIICSAKTQAVIEDGGFVGGFLATVRCSSPARVELGGSAWSAVIVVRRRRRRWDLRDWFVFFVS